MNIRKIAELAGVSVASVSRTLSKDKACKVSPKTREHIIKICEKHRYYPNMHMVRIYNNRANTVGFLIPQHCIQSESFHKGRMDENLSAAILGAEEELAESSTFLTLAAISERFISEKEHIKFHRSKTVDGILIWGWTKSDRYVFDLVREKVPLVMLQGKPEEENMNFVTPMDKEGMKMIIDHVFACGHRKISLVTPSMTSFLGKERFNGALDALKDHGIEPVCTSACQGFSIQSGYEACMEILKKRPKTTCIVCPNDLSAIGVIRAAREMKISVPEQLSITGADGIELYQPYNLTTYFSQSYEIGRIAARLLKSVIDNPEKSPEWIRVPVQFIEGDTVKKI